MANRKIGSLLVSVGADTKPLEEGLARAERSVGKFGRTSARTSSRAQSSFSGLGGGISRVAGRMAMAGSVASAVGGVVAGVGGVMRSTVGTTNYDLDQQARRGAEREKLRGAIDQSEFLSKFMHWSDPSNWMEEMKLNITEGIVKAFAPGSLGEPARWAPPSPQPAGSYGDLGIDVSPNRSGGSGSMLDSIRPGAPSPSEHGLDVRLRRDSDLQEATRGRPVGRHLSMPEGWN